jgi:septal ring factor EnvC (AmiA/AmiB activator)
MIPGISDSLLQTAFLSSGQVNQPAAAPIQDSKEDILFFASMAFYLSQVHQAIMDAWKQFSETNQAIAQENDAAHKVRAQRDSELEGQRKRIEYYQQQQESEFIHSGIHHRQAAKFRYLEGKHIDGDATCRHLRIAV